jgi:hypothetical protein
MFTLAAQPLAPPARADYDCAPDAARSGTGSRASGLALTDREDAVNRIAFPITQQTTGAILDDLQTALSALPRREAILL